MCSSRESTSADDCSSEYAIADAHDGISSEDMNVDENSQGHGNLGHVLGPVSSQLITAVSHDESY